MNNVKHSTIKDYNLLPDLHDAELVSVDNRIQTDRVLSFEIDNGEPHLLTFKQVGMFVRNFPSNDWKEVDEIYSIEIIPYKNRFWCRFIFVTDRPNIEIAGYFEFSSLEFKLLA